MSDANNSEREAFEAWWHEGTYLNRRCDHRVGQLVDDDSAFEIWQAARQTPAPQGEMPETEREELQAVIALGCSNLHALWLEMDALKADTFKLAANYMALVMVQQKGAEMSVQQKEKYLFAQELWHRTAPDSGLAPGATT